MKGQGYDDEIKEKILAELASGTSLCALSRKYDIAKSTISGWKKALNNPGNEDKLDQFEQLRTKKKREFVEKAWSNIEAGNKLIQRRFERALDNEDAIDSLLSEIMSLPNTELSTEQKKALAKKLSNIRLDDVGKIAITLGTLYDKQALANKEPTNIEGQVKKFEDFD